MRDSRRSTRRRTRGAPATVRRGPRHPGSRRGQPALSRRPGGGAFRWLRTPRTIPLKPSEPCWIPARHGHRRRIVSPECPRKSHEIHIYESAVGPIRRKWRISRRHTRTCTPKSSHSRSPRPPARSPRRARRQPARDRCRLNRAEMPNRPRSRCERGNTSTWSPMANTGSSSVTRHGLVSRTAGAGAPDSRCPFPIHPATGGPGGRIPPPLAPRPRSEWKIDSTSCAPTVLEDHDAAGEDAPAPRDVGRFRRPVHPGGARRPVAPCPLYRVDRVGRGSRPGRRRVGRSPRPLRGSAGRTAAPGGPGAPVSVRRSCRRWWRRPGPGFPCSG